MTNTSGDAVISPIPTTPTGTWCSAQTAQVRSQKTYSYDAFGVEQDPDSTDPNPFRYCGEYFDKETGTYYLRARYYAPETGRFTQEDPSCDGAVVNKNWTRFSK